MYWQSDASRGIYEEEADMVKKKVDMMVGVSST